MKARRVTASNQEAIAMADAIARSGYKYPDTIAPHKPPKGYIK